MNLRVAAMLFCSWVCACSAPDAPALLGGAAVNVDASGALDAASADAAAADASRDGGVPDGGLEGGVDCPAGSRMLRDVRNCGAASAANPALQASMNLLQPGDVFTDSSVMTSSLACLPALVCVAAANRTLIFSDDPEEVVADGILYRDLLKAGTAYRIYVYHANGSAAPRKFAVVLGNAGAAAANVVVEREAAEAPTAGYLAVGKRALQAYLTPPAAPRIVSVPSSGRAALDATIERPALTGQLVHGIYDITPAADVTLWVLSLAANANSVAALPALAVLPYDGKHDRGTFPDADLQIVLPPSDGRVRKLRFGGGVTDVNLVGIDATRGAVAELRGNFGVRYTIVGNGLLLGASARGGAWTGVRLAEGGTTPIPLPRSAAALAPGADLLFLGKLEGRAFSFFTGGSSSLPLDVFAISY